MTALRLAGKDLAAKLRAELADAVAMRVVAVRACAVNVAAASVAWPAGREPAATNLRADLALAEGPATHAAAVRKEVAK